MPAAPTPVPTLPPKYIMDFMGIDEDDWVMYPAYYEAHYHEMAPNLVEFAQSVRDAALREAAEKCKAAERELIAEGSVRMSASVRWVHDVTLALVGSAPKEA